MPPYYYVGDETGFEDPESWTTSPNPANGTNGVPSAGDTVYIDGANITNNSGQVGTLLVTGAYLDPTEQVGGFGLVGGSVTDDTATIEAVSSGASLSEGATWTNTDSLDDESEIDIFTGGQLTDLGSDTVGATTEGAEIDVDGAGSVYSVSGILTDDGFIGATNGASLQFGSVSGTGTINVGGLTATTGASSASLGAVTLNSLNVSSGTVTAASLNLSILLLTGGTVTTGSIDVTSGQINVSGSSSSLTSTTLTLGGGGPYSYASVTIDTGASFTLGGGSLVLGTGSGSTFFTLTGAGSTFNYTGSLAIGTDGSGSFEVGTGASYTTAGAVTLGADPSGAGSIEAAGTGASLTVAGALTVGAAGSGIAGAGAGGTLTAQSVDAATVAGTYGDTVDSNGTAALLEVDGTMTIGGAGTADLEIENGGSVFVLDDTTLGAQAGALGVLLLSQGSMLNFGELTDGQAGQGRVEIGESGYGATLSATGVILGGLASGYGSASIFGPAGTLTDFGNLTVGAAGSGSLSVQSAGQVTTQGLYVGASAGASGAISVYGTYSLLSIKGNGTIGGAGLGAVQDNYGGAITILGSLVLGAVGQGYVGLSNQALLTASTIIVGASGSADLDISTAGTLNASDVVIGDKAAGDGAIVVDGTHSVVAALFGVDIANAGIGSLAVTGGGYAGGQFTSIGVLSGSYGTLTVDGKHSVFSANNIEVGVHGTAEVTVSNTATLQANTTLTIGAEAGGSGTLTTTTGGELIAGGAVQVGGLGNDGTLIAQSGAALLLSAGLSVANTGVVLVTGALSALITSSIAVTRTGDSGPIHGGSVSTANSGEVIASQGITLDGGILDASGGGLIEAGPVPTSLPTNTILTGGAGLITGYGTLVGTVDNGGTLHVGGTAAGTLAVIGVLSDSAGTGTVSVGAGSTLDLTQAATANITDLDIASGGGIAVTNTLTITDSYANVDFGTGDSFNRDADRSGGGMIVGADAALAIIGTAVGAGASTTPTLTFAAQANGMETASFTIQNTGSGAGVIGAIETAGLTGVSGLTAGNFTLSAGAVSATYTLSFDSTQGNPTGQTILIDDEFDNIAPITITLEAPCYRRGTRIATIRGQVAVEHLAAGDVAITPDGRHAPIMWLGHRRIDCRRHADPARILPVRVRAGAFADGRPCRDLFLSPDHAVLADGVLIPIKHLINGHGIAQIDCDAVEYWHVELARHDILLAENLPAESYLDTGNRSAFANGGGAIALHPDFTARSWSDACAALVEQGPVLVAVKQRLFARDAIPEGGRKLGLQVLADQVAVVPVAWAHGTRHYAVPRNARSLNLLSPPWVPAATFAASLDRRRLGVRILGVAIDRRPVPLTAPSFFSGFHPAETTPEGPCRWTDGDARLVLPPGAATVTLNLADDGDGPSRMSAARGQTQKKKDAFILSAHPDRTVDARPEACPHCTADWRSEKQPQQV